MVWMSFPQNLIGGCCLCVPASSPLGPVVGVLGVPDQGATQMAKLYQN